MERYPEMHLKRLYWLSIISKPFYLASIIDMEAIFVIIVVASDGTWVFDQGAL